MFPEFSSLFGRDFVVGHFLPALVFASVVSVIALCLGTDVKELQFDSDVPELLFTKSSAGSTGILPANGRIVVSVELSTAVSPSAASKSSQVLQEGRVVEVDHHTVLDSGERAANEIEVGDRILFAPGAGMIFWEGKAELRILAASDVVAVKALATRNRRPLPPTITQLTSAKSIVVFVLISWVLGITLYAVNRELYRFAEGYGSWNPLKLFAYIERARFDQMNRRIKLLKDLRPNLSPAQNTELARLAWVSVQSFPDRAYLMPTAFGNIIRAFEVYSRIMYGFDANPGWDRLEALLNEENRTCLSTRKSQVDFWLNLWMLTLLLLLGLSIIWWFGAAPWWSLLVALVALYAIISRAKASAVQWGEAMKAAIDIQLPELAQKLGLQIPTMREEERVMWTQFTQAILFRLPNMLPDRSEPESPPAKQVCEIVCQPPGGASTPAVVNLPTPPTTPLPKKNKDKGPGKK